MNHGISIDFAGRCLQYFRVDAFGQAQHVDGAVNACLHGLNGVFLIMDRACWAGEIVNFVALDIERKCYVVANQFKTRISKQMINIAFGTGEEIVDADDFIPLFEQFLT